MLFVGLVRDVPRRVCRVETFHNYGAGRAQTAAKRDGPVGAVSLAVAHRANRPTISRPERGIKGANEGDASEALRRSSSSRTVALSLLTALLTALLVAIEPITMSVGRLLLLGWTTLALVAPVRPYSVLVFMPYGSHSHKATLIPVIKGLVE